MPNTMITISVLKNRWKITNCKSKYFYYRINCVFMKPVHWPMRPSGKTFHQSIQKRWQIMIDSLGFVWQTLKYNALSWDLVNRRWLIIVLLYYTYTQSVKGIFVNYLDKSKLRNLRSLYFTRNKTIRCAWGEICR